VIGRSFVAGRSFGGGRSLGMVRSLTANVRLTGIRRFRRDDAEEPSSEIQP